MNYILRLLGELEKELLSSGTALWSKRVDIDKCINILSKVASSLPKIMDEADIIVSEKNRILENARENAKAIIEEAELRAYAEINNNSIKRRAEMQASEIRRQAEQDCKTLSAENNAVIASMYENLERYISDVLSTTRKNKEFFVSPKPKTATKKKKTSQRR